MKIKVYLKGILEVKAAEFCEIFTLLLTAVHIVKSKGKILKFFLALSEYKNSICLTLIKSMSIQNHLVFSHHKIMRVFRQSSIKCYPVFFLYQSGSIFSLFKQFAKLWFVYGKTDQFTNFATTVFCISFQLFTNC